jgi:hypothetical protein
VSIWRNAKREFMSAPINTTFHVVLLIFAIAFLVHTL